MNLYRYRSIDEWSILGIQNNEFHFTSPSNFNDPFDCKNLFTFDGATAADWRIFLTNNLIHTQPHLTDLQRKDLVEKVIKSGDHRSREVLAEQGDMWGKILEKQSSRLGIVCLSKKRDDILMWSHYGCYHKGFCLQFDADILEKSFFCSAVKYRKQYPTFHEFVRADLDKIAEIFVQTKSVHWKYEKEVRLIINAVAADGGEPIRTMKYPREALTGIIFGCSTSDADKQLIANALKENGTRVPFSQCVKSSSSYSVKVVTTEIPENESVGAS